MSCDVVHTDHAKMILAGRRSSKRPELVTHEDVRGEGTITHPFFGQVLPALTLQPAWRHWKNWRKGPPRGISLQHSGKGEFDQSA